MNKSQTNRAIYISRLEPDTRYTVQELIDYIHIPQHYITKLLSVRLYGKKIHHEKRMQVMVLGSDLIEALS